MLYTSYFAMTKKLLNAGFDNLVAISGYVPEFYSKQMKTDNRLKRCLELAPKKDWWFDWKNGKISNDQFKELYYKTVLEKIDIENLLEKFGDNVVFLCYEKSGDFCHRHLFAEYLKEKIGLEVVEIKF